MQLYRLRIRPLSGWRTPWQSDTLVGSLCWTCARWLGEHVLEEEILAPAIAGNPPFVVSDAFPGDLLPIPLSIRLQQWPSTSRKRVFACRWIERATFLAWQKGGQPAVDALLDESPIRPALQLRNMLDRQTQGTGGAGLLFQADELQLADPEWHLTIYVRLHSHFKSRFLELIRLLAHSGFGSDASVGKGQFDPGGLEPFDELDDVAQPEGVVVLSTFQPGLRDPTQGHWEVFTKYGKLGPDFGLGNVFKRPLIMFRPGSCFRMDAPVPFVGRTIPSEEFLAEDVCRELASRNCQVCHWAFGLAVPTRFTNRGSVV